MSSVEVDVTIRSWSERAGRVTERGIWAEDLVEDSGGAPTRTAVMNFAWVRSDGRSGRRFVIVTWSRFTH